MIAAELLNDALGGKGGVAIIEGSPGQSTTLLRTQGLKDGLAKLGSAITIIGSQTADWNPVKAKDVAQAFLTAYGDDLKGVFAQDDNSGAAAAEVFKAAGRGDIKVVGTGGTINGLKAIREGLMYGTMDQSPTTDAKQALEFAIKLAKGEAAAAEAQHHPDAEDHLDQRRSVQGRVVIDFNLPVGGIAPSTGIRHLRRG